MSWKFLYNEDSKFVFISAFNTRRPFAFGWIYESAAAAAAATEIAE